LSRDDALSYSDWWEDRVLTDGIGAGTANKNIAISAALIRAVNKRLKLGLDDVFAATRIQAVAMDNARRLPSSSSRRHSCAWQTQRVDEEAPRHGLRHDGNRRATSEIVNLTAAQIVLDAPIPFIRIAPKVACSRPNIPNATFRLSVWRWTPCVGIPTASALLRQGVEPVGNADEVLRQSRIAADRQTQDLFVPAQLQGSAQGGRAPEELIDEMMGIAPTSEVRRRYGLGLKLKYLQMIALTPTAGVAAAA